MNTQRMHNNVKHDAEVGPPRSPQVAVAEIYQQCALTTKERGIKRQCM